jgi:hypothetical protein
MGSTFRYIFSRLEVYTFEIMKLRMVKAPHFARRVEI